MAYDQKCYDLAEAFLEDMPHLNTEGRRDALAKEIQETIEGFIALEELSYEPSQYGDTLFGGFPERQP